MNMSSELSFPGPYTPGPHASPRVDETPGQEQLGLISGGLVKASSFDGKVRISSKGRDRDIVGQVFKFQKKKKES